MANVGPVSWFKKPSDDGPAGTDAASPEVEPLTDDEVEWVRTTIAELAEQDVRPGDIDDLGRHYDELLTVWLRLRESDRPDPNAIVTQIGLAFGQHIADHTGLAWGVANHPSGVEIALHRPRTPGQVLLYPAQMITTRWDAHDTGVLPTLARATIRAVLDMPEPGQRGIRS